MILGLKNYKIICIKSPSLKAFKQYQECNPLFPNFFDFNEFSATKLFNMQ